MIQRPMPSPLLVDKGSASQLALPTGVKAYQPLLSVASTRRSKNVVTKRKDVDQSAPLFILDDKAAYCFISSISDFSSASHA